MQPFAQRSRVGWIGVPEWVVIVERALTLFPENHSVLSRQEAVSL
jgi:hypothetical protein